MRFYEPIAVGLFVVTVLAASYMLGKRMGYESGYAQGFESANTDALAESHVSGYNQSLDTLAGTVRESSLKLNPELQEVATN